MSSGFTTIDGDQIRKMLRDRGLPGGSYKECCGGRRVFDRDYETQLRRLKMTGKWTITERGVMVDKVVIPEL